MFRYFEHIKSNGKNEHFKKNEHHASGPKFHLFCEQEQLQKHATPDKNPYCVYGTLNFNTVVSLQEKIGINVSLFTVFIVLQST